MWLHLYWLDKNKSKGMAENLHLYVDYASKTYQKVINFTNRHGIGSIEVKRRADILEYVEALKATGFLEKKA